MQTVMSILPLDVVGFFALVCVFMAMTGLGAGMNPARLNLSRADRWRVGAAVTIALVAVPIVTLLLAKALDLRSAALVGILLVGISPGAPLALRKSRESGGEAGFATVLQVTVALLSIVAVPAWIIILGALYGKDAGISVVILAKQVFIAQILPLACGIALVVKTPAFAKRIASPLLRASGILMLVLGAADRLAGLACTARRARSCRHRLGLHYRRGRCDGPLGLRTGARNPYGGSGHLRSSKPRHCTARRFGERPSRRVEDHHPRACADHGDPAGRLSRGRETPSP